MGVLTRPGPFRTLWAARTISYVGDGVSRIALVALAARHGPSGVGLVLLANTVPRFLGPLAGALADRAERRALLVACELAQCLLMAVIALTLPSLGVLVALVAGMGLFATAFGPASSSILPSLVGPEALTRANAALGTALNLQVTLGPALGGLAIALGGTRSALVADAVSFGLAALLLTRLPRLPSAAEAQSVLAGTLEGLAYVARTPAPRALMLGLLIFVTFAAVDNVALIFLVRDDLQAPTAAFGFTYACFGVGMLAASLSLGALRSPPAPRRLILLGCAVGSAGMCVTGLAPWLAVAVAGQVLAGAANGADNIALAGLVQQLVPPALLGRVFGAVGTAAQVGSALAYTLAGPLIAATSARAVFVAGGLGSLLALPILARGLRVSR